MFGQQVSASETSVLSIMCGAMDRMQVGSCSVWRDHQKNLIPVSEQTCSALIPTSRPKVSGDEHQFAATPRGYKT